MDADGTAYATILTSRELAELRRLFQQRHLLAHREGMVDQEYVDRSGDTTAALGDASWTGRRQYCSSLTCC